MYLITMSSYHFITHLLLIGILVQPCHESDVITFTAMSVMAPSSVTAMPPSVQKARSGNGQTNGTGIEVLTVEWIPICVHLFYFPHLSVRLIHSQLHTTHALPQPPCMAC